ncbi:MAG TPA: hypothetical protein VK589_06155 [Chryseolinea sp.]|nr:hypothetical protein [Chryseolinea sp.]
MGYRKQFWEHEPHESDENEKLSIENARLTEALKKSIEYEQRKSDVMNLLNHSRQDLSLMIEVIDEERKATEHRIDSRQYMLDNAEDMEEGLEVDQRDKLAKDREKLESLLAWRMLYVTAWSEVKR